MNFARLADYVLIQVVHMKVIFTHLKFWVAAAGHNLSWGKIIFHNVASRVNLLVTIA